MMLALLAGPVVLVVGAGLSEPFGVDFDKAGRTYIVEMANRVSILGANGGLRIFAGNGMKGFGGDGGPAAQALLNGPHHLLMGPDGALYIADTWNYSVRRIDLATETIARVAGTGVKGFSGDGGPAKDAQFGGIFSIAFAGGRLYICDLDNRRVRAVDLQTGIVTTVAGNGARGVPKDGEDAKTQPLVDPRAIDVDSAGNLYICDIYVSAPATPCVSWITPAGSARSRAPASAGSRATADRPCKRASTGRSTRSRRRTATC